MRYNVYLELSNFYIRSNFSNLLWKEIIIEFNKNTKIFYEVV